MNIIVMISRCTTQCCHIIQSLLYLFPDDDTVDERREEAGYVGDGVGDAHERARVVGAEVSDVDHVAGDLARRQGGRHHHGRDRLAGIS